MKLGVGLLMVLILVSCGSSKNRDATTNESLNEWIANKSFEIESDFAMPMNTMAVSAVLNSNILGPGNNSGQISLIGNANYLRIKGDSIYAELPFFGERRMGGGYNSRDTGIHVKDLAKNYKVTTKRGMYVITFSAKDKQGNEAYDFIINLSPNLNADFSVNSTQRTVIQFRGAVAELQAKEEDSE